MSPSRSEDRQQYRGFQREGGWGGGKGGQMYGDREGFDFGGWAHNAVHKSCMIELYT